MRKIIYFLLITVMCMSCNSRENKQQPRNTKQVLVSLLQYCDIREYLDSLKKFYPTDPADYAWQDSIVNDSVMYTRIDYAKRELDTVVDHWRYVCRTYGTNGLEKVTREEFFKRNARLR